MPDPRGRPFAYLVTFSCYGARVHGDPRGSVDRSHNQPGTPYAPENAGRAERERSSMRQPPYLLDLPRREAALRGLIVACSRRGWALLAAHVRTNHLHAAIAGPERPDRLIPTLKAYCTRLLNAPGINPKDRMRWSRGGSRRGLWSQQSVDKAIDYVLAGQGEPMEIYPKAASRERE